MSLVRPAAWTAFLASAVAAAAMAEVPFLRQPLPNGHPALGAWRIELPQINCFEQMDFRADGTRSVISGREIAQAEFSIASAPDARGFYGWSDRIITTNGEPDCTGSRTQPGKVSVGYMVFDDEQTKFFLCSDVDGKACIGPYVKLGGTDS